jgi:signal transduction histidine kinase
MPSAPELFGRPPATPPRPDAGRRGWAGWAASLLLATVFAARVLEHFAGTPQWALAAGLLGAFLILFLALPLMARRSRWLTHFYFALQSALVVRLLFVPPHFDGVTALFVALALQAALVFPRRALVAGVAALVLLMVVPSMLLFGWVRGLALMIVPAVACVILPAYVIAHQEIEAARLESQRLLEELQAAQRRLQAYAAQAEELAAVEARNRLARELHDSVSQTMFSIILNVRSTQILLEREPARVRPQLEQLQELSSRALSEMRALISQWHPG